MSQQPTHLYQSHLSTEYVRIPVKVLENGEEIDPTDIPIRMSFTAAPYTSPVEADWQAAEWETNLDGEVLDGVRYRYFARVLVGPDGGLELVPGKYRPWLDADDSPERVVRITSLLVITGEES